MRDVTSELGRLNEFQTDVLAALSEALDCKLQRNAITRRLNPKYVPKKYDYASFDVTLSRALARLCKLGLIKKIDEGHQHVFYQLKENRRTQVREFIGQKEIAEFIMNLPADRKQKFIDEGKYYTRQEKIRQLKKVPLPTKSIISKVQEGGLKIDEFEPKTWNTVYVSKKVKNEELGEEVEIKVLPETNLTDKNMDKKVEIDTLAPFGWKQVATSATGQVLFCRYKVLGQLIEEQFEAALPRWKEEQNISDEKWKEIEPYLRKYPTEIFLSYMLGEDLGSAENIFYVGSSR